MWGTHNLPLFFATAITLTMTPGPSTLYILGRSVSQGRQAGVLSVLGIGSGSLCHTAAVAFGLSALLAASQIAFSIVKYAGGAYLIYLGVRTLRNNAGQLVVDLSGLTNTGLPMGTTTTGSIIRQNYHSVTLPVLDVGSLILHALIIVILTAGLIVTFRQSPPPEQGAV